MANSYNYKIAFSCVGFSVVCASVGQLFWKLAAGGNSGWLWAGFALYALGTLAMIVAYRHGPLSVLQPMMSVSYILGLGLGYWVLHEVISSKQLLGVAVIIAGVVCLRLSHDK